MSNSDMLTRVIVLFCFVVFAACCFGQCAVKVESASDDVRVIYVPRKLNAVAEPTNTPRATPGPAPTSTSGPSPTPEPTSVPRPTSAPCNGDPQMSVDCDGYPNQLVCEVTVTDVGDCPLVLELITTLDATFVDGWEDPEMQIWGVTMRLGSAPCFLGRPYASLYLKSLLDGECEWVYPGKWVCPPQTIYAEKVMEAYCIMLPSVGDSYE